MSERRALMERLIAALERIAPAVTPPTDWLGAPAYFWTSQGARPVEKLEALPLDTLRGIDEQKQAFVENLRRLSQGYAAHDMLLWGARGMGKSALVRAATAHVQASAPRSLALIQVAQDALHSLPELFAALADQERAFVLFIDDLGFGGDARNEALSLRSLLEGGVTARPANVRLAVTSNRRAIVSRESAEQDSPLNERDARDDALALADRFGLRLGFHPCGRAAYLEIVRSYLDPLGLAFEEEEALAWSIEHGNLSGRSAYQFAVELAGRAGMAL